MPPRITVVIQDYRRLTLRSLRSQLYTMPTLNLIRQYGVNKLMLFDHRQALELRRLDLESVH